MYIIRNVKLKKKKKERKYIAVKKKKNSAVCSSIVKRTKTLIFWNSNASLILKGVECVFKKKSVPLNYKRKKNIRY